MQQQLVDLLVLAGSMTQTRWTMRGPAAERLGARLRAAAAAIDELAEATAEHMVVSGWLPNGTLLAQLIAEVDTRAPEWWPAQEGVALAASDVASVEHATSRRAAILERMAPSSAELLEKQVTTLHEHHIALSE